MPFWEMMVRNGRYAFWARRHFDALDDRGAVWCFDRFGMSRTTLGDGRTLFIAGEHEDSYDPDFCIYNDLIVKYADGGVEIFGYPRDVFPPTDFHTATLVGDRLILIGSVGYRDERVAGHTPVYELGLADLRITEIKTTGEAPGWISRHGATLDKQGRISVRDGKVMTLREGKQNFRRNADEFSLDAVSGHWERLTRRRWHEFSIRPDPHLLLRFALRKTEVPLDELLASDLAPLFPGEQWNERLLLVEGVRVLATLNSHDLRLVIEGELPDDLLSRLVQDISRRIEEFAGGSCAIEEL